MEQIAGADSLPEVYSSALKCLQDTLDVERSSLLVFDQHGILESP
jgi:hypothetical protein